MPIQMLKKDHRKVEELMSACKNTQNPSERAELMGKIIKELEIHMQIEEEMFYPLVSGASEEGEQMVRHSKREHEEMKGIISSLSDTDEADEEDDENLKRLELAKNDHVREEEQKMFPFAEINLQDEIGLILSTKMLAMKEKLKMQK